MAKLFLRRRRALALSSGLLAAPMVASGIARAADDWPNLVRLAASGALLPLGLAPADLATPQALGRALQRLTTKPAPLSAAC